jgi:hypothetical protein
MPTAIHRRDLIKATLATGAMLALPGRTWAQGPSPDFERAFDVLPDPVGATEANAAFIGATPETNAAQLLPQRDVVAIADFARPSALPRLHLVRLEAGTVQSFLVAHGRGSDPEHDGWLKSFSNAVGSEATSRGAYLINEEYPGKYGTSLRLHGLDPDNSNAYDRAIVMHPAWYAAPDMLAKWGKLGRSEGCFAMDPEHFAQALAGLGGGHLLFADRIEAV